VSEPTDEALFDQFRAGDLNAFRTLVERYHDDLLRFLTRLLGDRQGAEDVFQDAFIQVHQSADTFDRTRRFRPWVFTIAANKGRDFLRKKNRRQEVDLHAPVSRGGSGDEGRSTTYVDLMEIDIPGPSARMTEAERDLMVQRALDALPYALREILLLAYFQRLSYAQIAEELRIPLGTVKSRLHAAVAGFATRWKDLSGQAG
jgi:RNA polymerase sigma-70 factor (ECF subfamily)